MPIKQRWFVGRIMRISIKDICVGLFWGPFDGKPNARHLQYLRPCSAILCQLFFATYAKNGRWLIVDSSGTWNVSEWCMPSFKYYDGVSGKWHCRRYSEYSFTQTESDEVVSESDAANLPQDGLANSYAIEVKLKRLNNEIPKVIDLERLVKRASDIPPQHFIYFCDGEIAIYAKQQIDLLGLEVIVRPPTSKITEWLVLVQHSNLNVSRQEIELIEARLRSIVVPLGGEYVGWDCPTV